MASSGGGAMRQTIFGNRLGSVLVAFCVLAAGGLASAAGPEPVAALAAIRATDLLHDIEVLASDDSKAARWVRTART
jgi:hypothetical protein